ncbi:MAG TPA: toll/interleukin-1 receptor domain-containing protein [Puia sp.]|nr:toll/interleukin-1 receptor domain-containing protein [Puia sp.]
MILSEWLQFAPQPRPLKDQEKWHVFLSYRSIDRPWVLNLYDVLVDLGHKVFLDQYVLKPGDHLIRNLQDALDASQAAVLIWSAATKGSVWVNDEYEYLQQRANKDRDFIFVPVTMDGSELPAFARNRIYVDFSGYPEGPNGGDLLRLLYALANKPLSEEAIQFASDQDEAAAVANALLNNAKRHNKPDRLLQLFHQGGLVWKTSAALGCKTAECLTSLGYNDEAIAVLAEVEKSFPKAIRPIQLHGLALAKRGSSEDLEQAQEILGLLLEKNNADSETLGIYGRTWMDRYKRTQDETCLRQSRRYYAEAFERQPYDYYTGINSAAKSVFLGEMDKAMEYLQRVETIVGDKPARDDYWKTATVAEVLLIKKQYPAAAAMYRQAVDMAPGQKGSILSTWGQAALLLESLGAGEKEVAQIRTAFKDYV